MSTQNKVEPTLENKDKLSQNFAISKGKRQFIKKGVK